MFTYKFSSVSSMFKLIFAVIVLCSINCNAKHINSLYNDNYVTEFTPKSFKNDVIDGSHSKIWIIVFYSPRCISSQDLAPEFVKAAQKMQRVVQFGAINGDKYKRMRYRYDVPSIPCIKIFGRNKQIPQNYTGDYTAKDLIRAAWTLELNNCYYKS